MNLFKVGAASLNQTPRDWRGNVSRIVEAIKQAEKEGCDLLLTPELSVTGYGCEDDFLSPDLQARALKSLGQIQSALTTDMVVAVGLPVLHQNALFNCVAVIKGFEGLIGLVPKQNLAGDGIHYEPRWFNPWPSGVVGQAQIGVPIGDLCFQVLNAKGQSTKFGFEICEDAWVAQRPGGRLVKRGVDVILNPSASHFAFGKYLVREDFVIEGSRSMGCTYVYANLLGNEAGRAVYEGGNLIAQTGTLLVQGKRFSYEDIVLDTAVVDIDLSRTRQSATHSFSPSLGPDPGLVSSGENLGLVKHQAPSPVARASSSFMSKEQEFEEAACLALFDYMRKSKSKGYVVSLSGGIDSAACVELIGLMVRRGLEELGHKRFFARTGLETSWVQEDPPDNQQAYRREANVRNVVQAVLTTAYQATANSSEQTQRAALEVAKGVGCTHHVLDVDSLVAGYTDMISRALGQELTWETHDIALQNIQARVRVPSVWMIANIEGKILAATSNRSETAVGYTTMDGDTAGGIAPVAGVDKAFLQKWLLARETADGSTYLWPVNGQKPTAELRPSEEEQTDENDLMPYDVLEAIEEMAIRDKKSPIECYCILTQKSQGLEDRQRIHDWVVKFFQLWTRNQWKRERFAPSFHYDDKNLDPKTWCRFPILNSGFEVELEELFHHHQSSIGR